MIKQQGPEMEVRIIGVRLIEVRLYWLSETKENGKFLCLVTLGHQHGCNFGV